MSNAWLPYRVKDPWDEGTVQSTAGDSRESNDDGNNAMALEESIRERTFGNLERREVSRMAAVDWGRFETVRGKAAGAAKTPQRSSVSEGLSPIFPERASGLNGSSEFPSEFALSTRPPSSFLTLQAGHLHQRTIQLLSLIDF